jgi:hypothetical protein
MKLPRSRENGLIELAEDIAGQFSPTGIVDVAHICRKKRIRVIHEHYSEGKFDGMLRLRDHEWFILCNRDSGNTPGSVRLPTRPVLANKKPSGLPVNVSTSGSSGNGAVKPSAGIGPVPFRCRHGYSLHFGRFSDREAGEIA